MRSHRTSSAVRRGSPVHLLTGLTLALLAAPTLAQAQPPPVPDAPPPPAPAAPEAPPVAPPAPPEASPRAQPPPPAPVSSPALPPAPPSEPAAPPQVEPGQVPTGFVVGAGLLVSSSSSVATGDDLLFSLTAVTGNLMIGYKIHRVILGLGVDVASVSTDIERSWTVTRKSSESVTSFLISPSVQVALARSSDQRAELFTAGQIGIGVISRSSEPSMTAEEPTTRHLGFRLGLGVRYWVHPHIGLSLASGLGGDYASGESPHLDGVTKWWVGMTSLFGSLGVVGVF